ncbi:MAG: hypothetical protein AAGI52_12945 [Bacteroidota bacterium]
MSCRDAHLFYFDPNDGRKGKWVKTETTFGCCYDDSRAICRLCDDSLTLIQKARTIIAATYGQTYSRFKISNGWGPAGGGYLEFNDSTGVLRNEISDGPGDPPYPNVMFWIFASPAMFAAMLNDVEGANNNFVHQGIVSTRSASGVYSGIVMLSVGIYEIAESLIAAHKYSIGPAGPEMEGCSLGGTLTFDLKSDKAFVAAVGSKVVSSQNPMVPDTIEHHVLCQAPIQRRHLYRLSPGASRGYAYTLVDVTV